MADGLDVVAVGIGDERAVVVLVVVRAHAGRAVVLAIGSDRGDVERLDLGASLGAKRDVCGGRILAGADPEVGLVIDPEADRLTVVLAAVRAVIVVLARYPRSPR